MSLSKRTAPSQINSFGSNKQDVLISGTNIKTINGTSLLGSGNITVGVSPLTKVIFVDSGIGDNATADGSTSKPYATVEYVLANVINTGTITGTTTNNSATITGVTDTSSISIGQYITGTGIPFGTICTAKTVNTITLSQNCTANGTVTITWYQPYQLILNGVFNATSNWYKQGFWINTQSSTVYWGALTLYNISEAPSINHYILGNGEYIGTTSTSNFLGVDFSNTGNLKTATSFLSVNFGNVNTISTGRVIDLRQNSGGIFKMLPFSNASIVGNNIRALNGTVLDVTFGSASARTEIGLLQFNSYGLLGGLISLKYCRVLGNHETPSAITALSGADIFFNGKIITGRINMLHSTFIGFIPNNIHSFTNCDVNLGTETNNTAVPGTITFTNCRINGSISASIALTLDGYCVLNTSILNGSNTATSITINSGAVVVNNGIINTASGNQLGITVNGRFINNNSINSTNNSTNVTIGGTGEFINNGNYVGLGNINLSTNGGRFTNMGITDCNINITTTSTVVNRGTISYSQTNRTVTINSASGIFENYGLVECTNASATVAPITKTTGILKLMPGGVYRTANTKGAIRCTANTSASKDIYLFNAVSNGDGSTYGLLIAFDGSSFAANDLVGGTIYENTAY